MYSVILMAAMTTAGEAPDCWFKGGCHGCYGGCYGSCNGGCYGCYGCSGGWGSCWGGCYGCYGWGTSYGCHGCYGCWGCYGSCYGSYGTMQMAVPAMPAKPEAIPTPKDKESLLPAKAKLIVELPADAKLFIDDQPIKNTNSPVRQFNTPELQPGQTFYYMVRVEVTQDGSPQSATRRILIRAGEEVTAKFTDMKAPSATVSTAKK
jgi:uncharacterized protein (TIGR03000 family)